MTNGFQINNYQQGFNEDWKYDSEWDTMCAHNAQYKSLIKTEMLAASIICIRHSKFGTAFAYPSDRTFFVVEIEAEASLFVEGGINHKGDPYDVEHELRDGDCFFIPQGLPCTIRTSANLYLLSISELRYS
jgi:mannose-6-phosphate isomerase-like protein (cupin superfamily)